MKTILPTGNKEHWPRRGVDSVETRKRDLVVRIADWMDDKDEPGYDVEIYIGGVYDWNESASFTPHGHKTEKNAKKLAIAYAQKQIGKLL
jgi:hypothetical protein